MDAILQFLIDWGYWGLFLGSFIAGSVLPFSSEAVLAACVGPLGLDPVISITAATAGNVAKMTEGHRHRRSDLANDVERRHYRDRCGKAEQISAESIRLYLGNGDQCKDEQGPAQHGGEIACRGIRADNA